VLKLVRKPKVGDDDVTSLVEEEVLELEVPVNDLL
jgi:hypothetical protein